MSDAYLSERERLGEIVRLLEHAHADLEEVRRAVAAYDDEAERRADWRAVAAAGIARMPTDAETGPGDALMQRGYIPAGRLARAATAIIDRCRGSADEHLRRYALGLRALASEMQRGATTDGGLDRKRVDAIGHGLRMVGAKLTERAQRIAVGALEQHARDVASLRGAGFGSLAETIERDPEIAEALDALARYAEAGARGETF